MIKTLFEESFAGIKYTKTRIVKIDTSILKNNKIIMAMPDDPRSDLFRILRTNILKQLRKKKWNNFLVTSATSGAGKSLIAVNLAIAIAMEGNHSVLLVDADLRSPSTCRHLGINPRYGIMDYLIHDVEIENILINPGIHNLVVLPGKPAANANFSEILSSHKMINLINELKTRYKSRIVIFDIPPLFVADDAMIFMSHFDAGLFVVEDEKNTPEELQHAMHLLEGINLLGIVLNKSKQPMSIQPYGQVMDE